MAPGQATWAYRPGIGGLTEGTQVTDGTQIPSPGIGLTERFRRPQWVAHVLDEASGEPHAILLHLPRGERIALSETGTRVWQLIVAADEPGTCVEAMAPVLAAEYNAQLEVVEADVLTLIEQLMAGDWIERVKAAT